MGRGVAVGVDELDAGPGFVAGGGLREVDVLEAGACERAAEEKATLSSGNSESLPMTSRRRVTGMTSGPFPQETER